MQFDLRDINGRIFRHSAMARIVEFIQIAFQNAVLAVVQLHRIGNDLVRGGGICRPCAVFGGIEQEYILLFQTMGTAGAGHPKVSPVRNIRLFDCFRENFLINVEVRLVMLCIVRHDLPQNGEHVAILKFPHGVPHISGTVFGL